MKSILIPVFLITILLPWTTVAYEHGVPFQFSLTPDVAAYQPTQLVRGMSLSIWGENPQEAFALGAINGSTGRSAGISFGLFNYADAYKGLQFSGFNSNNSLRGIQIGILNYTRKTTIGIQFGIINIISSNTGWFNDFPRSLAPVMIFLNWHFEDI